MSILFCNILIHIEYYPLHTICVVYHKVYKIYNITLPLYYNFRILYVYILCVLVCVLRIIDIRVIDYILGQEYIFFLNAVLFRKKIGENLLDHFMYNNWLFPTLFSSLLKNEGRRKGE